MLVWSANVRLGRCKVIVTYLDMSIKAALKGTNIMVNIHLELSVHLVPKAKRICSSFDKYMDSFYEFSLTRVGLWIPLSKFEVPMLKHVKVATSHIRSGSWAYIRFFQLCVEYKSWEPSLGLFSNIFSWDVHLLKTFATKGFFSFTQLSLGLVLSLWAGIIS